MDRTCPDCMKYGISTLSGLTRHLRVCPGPIVGTAASSTSSFDSEGEAEISVTEDAPIFAFGDSEEDGRSPTFWSAGDKDQQGLSDDEPTGANDSAAEDMTVRIHQARFAGQSEDDLEVRGEDEQLTGNGHAEVLDVDNVSTARPAVAKSITNASTVVRVETFPRAGEPTKEALQLSGLSVQTLEYGSDPSPSEPYAPFESEHEFKLAQWFLQNQVSKGGIDTYLKDIQRCEGGTPLSFTSAETLYKKIDSIPHGLPGNIAWRQLKVEIPSEFPGKPPVEYIALARPILPLLQHMVGFPLWRKHMTYEPKRLYNAEDHRIFNEVNTGNFWWKAQEGLEAGATLLALGLSMDETYLSQHNGNMTLLPCYINTFNLHSSIRNKDSMPGLLVLAYLPVIQKDAPVRKQSMAEVKKQVYHHLLRQILKPMEDASTNGVVLLCADGQKRKCFPRILGLMDDMPEQCSWTGVSYLHQCPICVAPKSEWGQLTKTWDLRDHEAKNEQLQALADESPSHQHSTAARNFAWNHPSVRNIHATIMLDPLHQLLLGVVKYAITWARWTVQLASTTSRQRSKESEVKPTKASKKPTSSLTTNSIVDQRFSQVPDFDGLKTWNKKVRFTRLSQLQGREYRSVLQQLLVVFAPLLLEKNEAGPVRYLRAICDFVMLVSLKSHDEGALQYMQHAITRIQFYQPVMFPARAKAGGDDDGGADHSGTTAVGHGKIRPTASNLAKAGIVSAAASVPGVNSTKKKKVLAFNIPKFHMMAHYIPWIREYGAPRNFTTEYGEHAHMRAKRSFRRTNKRDAFQIMMQIANHEDRNMKMLAMHALVVDRLTKPRGPAPDVAQRELSWPRLGAVTDLTQFQEPTTTREGMLLYEADLRSRYFRPATWFGRATNIPELVPALANFLRHERQRRNEYGMLDPNATIALDEALPINSRSGNSQAIDEAGGVLIQVHNALEVMVVPDHDNEGEPFKVTARCVHNWQKRGHRCDQIWIETSQIPNLLGQTVADILLICTIIEPKFPGLGDTKSGHFEYQAVLVHRYELAGIPGNRDNCLAWDPDHGLLTAIRPRGSTAANPRKLGPVRFVPLHDVRRRVHLVAERLDGDTDDQQRFLVNAFSDVHQYMGFGEEQGFWQSNAIPSTTAVLKSRTAKAAGSRSKAPVVAEPQTQASKREAQLKDLSPLYKAFVDTAKRKEPPTPDTGQPSAKRKRAT